jgi:sulfite exporter TauE/SafE
MRWQQTLWSTMLLLMLMLLLTMVEGLLSILKVRWRLLMLWMRTLRRRLWMLLNKLRTWLLSRPRPSLCLRGMWTGYLRR